MRFLLKNRFIFLTFPQKKKIISFDVFNIYNYKDKQINKMTMIEFIKNTHHWSDRRKNNLKAIRILQVKRIH